MYFVINIQYVVLKNNTNILSEKDTLSKPDMLLGTRIHELDMVSSDNVI